MKKDFAQIAAETAENLERYPPVPAISTRIGNSSGGTTLETPIWGRTKTFPDGAPIRLAIPTNASRVGLEYGPDKKTVLVRIHSEWNEGGWHDTYVTPEGQVVGGMFDVPFPRTDTENKIPGNDWQYGTGFWIDGGYPSGDASYRAGVPFKNLKEGVNSGVPGYTWQNSRGGLVIKTPKTTIYGVVPFEAAVTDPGNANLVFTQFYAFILNWGAKGGGKEVKSFFSTLDEKKYPQDARRSHNGTNPGPLKAVRAGGDLYIFSGEAEIMLHRWDEENKILVPVAFLCVRPDSFPNVIPQPPVIQWGQGAWCRADENGSFVSADWQVFNAGKYGPLWSGRLSDVDNEGSVYFFPRWEKPGDSGDAAYWKTFDLIKGVFAAENYLPLPLPDQLKQAEACEQIRVDWESGDLIAVVMRAGTWRLERYPGWRQYPHSNIAAVYSAAPVVLSVRRQYRNTSSWNGEWNSSPDESAGIPTAAFGSMVIAGGYIFIAEAQAGGLRIHRLSDGFIVGRVADKVHTNSTVDQAAYMQATESPTEIRVFLMDFHGKSVLVRRIAKKDLAAASKTAKPIG